MSNVVYILVFLQLFAILINSKSKSYLTEIEDREKLRGNKDYKNYGNPCKRGCNRRCPAGERCVATQPHCVTTPCCLIWNCRESLKDLGESCGSCFCPPTFTAGPCEIGLVCVHNNPQVPDAAGVCKYECGDKPCGASCNSTSISHRKGICDMKGNCVDYRTPSCSKQGYCKHPANNIDRFYKDGEEFNYCCNTCKCKCKNNGDCAVACTKVGCPCGSCKKEECDGYRNNCYWNNKQGCISKTNGGYGRYKG